MAYDLKLAEHIRAGMQGIPFVEKKMFGGVGFMLHGNMTCGVHKDEMIVRVDPAEHESLLKKKHAKPFAITGKPMKGWLLVEARGTKTTKQISDWIKAAVEFALTLPSK